MVTQRYVAQNSEASLIVLEQNKLRIYSLAARPDWSVGRGDPRSAVRPDIALGSAIASRQHGWLRSAAGQWYYVDNPGNTNGTFHNGVKIPRQAGNSQPVMLSGGDILRIDNADLSHGSPQGVVMLFTLAPVKGNWTSFSLRERNQVLIGREAPSDIILPLPYLSAKHARIQQKGGQFYLSDCGSTAGVFLNGKQIRGPVALREKDTFSLCDCSFFFLGGQLLYMRRDRNQEQAALRLTAPHSRPVVLKADIATKRVKDHSGQGMKELLRDIHLDIKEGTLVALLGTAGAGKSTVMNCLNGMDLEGVQGQVLYRGVDLMRDFDRMKYLIGSVPQQKIFREMNTPEEEFYQAAKLRLPGDTSKKEIMERVDRTLEMLSMTGVRKTRNSKLSGGEKTRVNVGIELVADRDLLCLDEPDQGLSPNYKHELFVIMRDLAHVHGKSVLSIIHDVSEIDLFDQVIMLAKVDGVGRLAFSGSPAEARRHFGVEDISQAYALLEKDPRRYVR